MGNVFHFKYILVCIGILLLASCAQIVSPGGGPKDITPPRAVKYVPDSASLFFKSKSIEIHFDEFIQLQDISQILISPPLDKAPDIKVMNKTLSITFDKKEILKPNTTYCFNFGNSIQDIHESNPAENFKYIFSTGSFIDSLIVRGKVENAFDHKTEKGTLVMLYSNYNDSSVYNDLPDYFGKTEDNGTFQINNVKAGKYKMIALKDGNANYKYDGDNETIGFIDTLVDALTKQNILIGLFQEPAKKLFIKKHLQYSHGKIVFVFNKTADSLKVKSVNHAFDSKDIIMDISANKDSLTYWFRNFENDTLALEISNGSKVLDTLEFKINKKEEALKCRKTPLILSLIYSPAGNQNFDMSADLKFGFNNPIDSIRKDSIIELKQDSLLVKNAENLQFEKTKLLNEIRINYKTKGIQKPTNNGSSTVHSAIKNPLLKENTAYHLLIPPGTFTDFFGLKNDSLKIDYKTREEKFYGTVKLKVSIPPDSSGKVHSSYIIQLLNEKEEVVRENKYKKEETISYDYLYPQRYRLKIIVDDNANGKWDPGNFQKKVQPENVIYYFDAINIRSNWDSELEWIIK